MAQRKISSYFFTKPNESVGDQTDAVLQKIKHEPGKEFLCILPSYQPVKELNGNFKVKIEKSESDDKIFKCEVCLKTFVLMSIFKILKF